MTRRSMGQHATDRTRCKELVRDAVEDPLAQSTVPVAAGHDQTCLLILNETQEFGGDWPPPLPPDVVHRGDSMAEKVACDVGKKSFWHWIPIRLRRSRRAEPLWPAAETQVHHARRGGTRAYSSTPPPRGGAAAERRCRAPPKRAGPPAARSCRDRQGHARCPQYAVLRL